MSYSAVRLPREDCRRYISNSRRVLRWKLRVYPPVLHRSRRGLETEEGRSSPDSGAIRYLRWFNVRNWISVLGVWGRIVCVPIQTIRRTLETINWHFRKFLNLEALLQPIQEAIGTSEQGHFLSVVVLQTAGERNLQIAGTLSDTETCSSVLQKYTLSSRKVRNLPSIRPVHSESRRWSFSYRKPHEQ